MTLTMDETFPRCFLPHWCSLRLC